MSNAPQPSVSEQRPPGPALYRLMVLSAFTTGATQIVLGHLHLALKTWRLLCKNGYPCKHVAVEIGPDASSISIRIDLDSPLDQRLLR